MSVGLRVPGLGPQELFSDYNRSAVVQQRQPGQQTAKQTATAEADIGPGKGKCL